MNSIARKTVRIRNTRSLRRRRGGFTLVEVMLVMVILAMLAGVGIVGINKARKTANIRRTEILVGEVTNAINMYNSTMNAYPGSDTGLTALIEVPSDSDQADRWREGGPFVTGGEIPKDAWGNALQYELTDEDTADDTGVYFHVYSMGPNGVDDNGTEDDIPAWADKD